MGPCRILTWFCDASYELISGAFWGSGLSCFGESSLKLDAWGLYSFFSSSFSWTAARPAKCLRSAGTLELLEPLAWAGYGFWALIAFACFASICSYRRSSAFWYFALYAASLPSASSSRSRSRFSILSFSSNSFFKRNSSRCLSSVDWSSCIFLSFLGFIPPYIGIFCNLLSFSGTKPGIKSFSAWSFKLSWYISSTSVIASYGLGPFKHYCIYCVTLLLTSILFRISRIVGLS